MPFQSWQHLSRINSHPRDKHIYFHEPSHTYYVNNISTGNISCTGFIHEFFGHFDPKAILTKMRKNPAKWAQSKYFGKTDDEIIKEWNDNGKTASEAGTAMHLAIEQFLHGAPEQIAPETFDSIEWKYFMKFWKDCGDDLEPYRSEWEVWTSSDIKLCGSIDMVFRRKSDGKFVIYDWKRSKEIKADNPFGSGLAPLDHLPDCNYWHYTMQLNVYKWMLERYYGLEVADLYIVIIHPNNPSYRRMRLNILEDEVEDMIEARRRAVEAGGKVPVILPVPEEPEPLPQEKGKPLANFAFKF
jgi:ATP-dependent exoDNAse (exonuclease V) beta subunit